MKPETFFRGKPSLAEYRLLAPDLSEEECSRQLVLLPEQYFRRYSRARLARNASRLASLNGRNPYFILFDSDRNGSIELTLITFDMEALFSLVTGALGAGGLDIQSGDIFTYRSRTAEEHVSASGGVTGGRRRRRAVAGPEDMRKVVDVFRGERGEDADGPSPAAFREGLERMLRMVLGDLFRGWPPGGGSGREKMPEKRDGRRGAVSATGAGAETAKQRVAEQLSKRLLSLRGRFSPPQMFPIEMDFAETDEGNTRLHVRSQDTPFFLYTIGTVLSVHGISIEHVEIKTTARAIEDTFYVRTRSGQPLTNPELQRSLKLSILFTKQFTYFLWDAPDPYRALLRFENLLGELRSAANSDTVSTLISDSKVLRRLSKLLGASDFIWEDFVRLQYENIIPLLSGENISGELDMGRRRLEGELNRRLEGVSDFEEQKRVLNQFKDWFTYLADLEHILDPEAGLLLLNERLTDLAELVVDRAFRIAWDFLVESHGAPLSVAGLPAGYAVFGLGKFGGRALGYASDIELMTVFRDAGETGGAKKISNTEFFSSLVRTASLVIESKQEGIYRVDLRLRPHGSGGPLAVRLTNFVSYYREEASSLEKLALVRLRFVAGDPELGAQVERMRDTILYEGGGIDVADLVRLRKIQAEKYNTGETPNVKYGPGGLVDLEYCVQTLQVLDGCATPKLRTPYMTEVFPRLMELGTLDRETSENLERAYFFLRRLLNALRMLRGNALDLYLPARESSEFFHLARRLGFHETGGVSAEEQLWIEFQKHTAMVRYFVEHQLGSQAVIHRGPGNIADLLLAEDPDPEEISSLFAQGGFADGEKGFSNFRALGRKWPDRTRFIELALFAWDYLQQGPDPDMALNNWERFLGTHPDPEAHFTELHLQPKRLEVLLRIFAASQYMADLLVRNPDFFSVVTDPEKILVPMKHEDFREELSALRRDLPGGDHYGWRRALRMFRHRCILRIGSRDVCYGVPLEEIFAELSALAEAILQEGLEYRLREAEWGPDPVCILAFGKLGGRELNYSSDIDLVVLFEAETDREEASRKKLRRLIRELRGDLAEVTGEGWVYRVDFRLRPFGRSGDLVFTPHQMEEYYHRAAALWEFQALLKARPVAGDTELGDGLLESLRQNSIGRLGSQEIVESVSAARREGGNPARPLTVSNGINVKEGPGGLRDIEFLVQALQLIHGRETPRLISGNTLDALQLLKEEGILEAPAADSLAGHYRFLRRVEHFLQLLEDRQEHSLPADPAALASLAGRMRWIRISSGDFGEQLHAVMREVREMFLKGLSEKSTKATKM